MEPLSLDECGLLQWRPKSGDWGGDMPLPSGRAISITVLHDPHSPPPSDQWRRTILSRLRWIRSHEAAMLAAIADQLFEGWVEGWRDDEIDTITSKEEFTKELTLEGILVLAPPPSLELIVAAGNLFGGHRIALEVGENGEILGGEMYG